MGSNLLRYLMCRQFRTYFLLLLTAVFICQSFLVYYILAKVKETEGPSQMESATAETLSKEKELGYAGKFLCDVTTKTAMSAVRRATTQKCKQELSEIACGIKSKKIFPEKLPNYCTRKNSTPGSFLGCFHDDGESRLLSSYGVKLNAITIQKCINICVQSSYPYAGIRKGKECYCGSEKPLLIHLLDQSYCNIPCDGQPQLNCGGKDATQVFDTGVPSKVSLKLQQPFENATLPIAFILTLNGRSLRQVTRLLRMIYRPHHIYLIHIDARQDYLFRSLLHLELEFTNIRLTRRRESSIWGGVSLLDVLIDSMSQLLDMGSKWQFVLNLSESDFPLRSIDSLEAFLAANKDRNFLKSHGRQTRQFIHKQGLDRVFHQCESRMWRVGDRTLPQGIRFDGGSDWIAITRSLAQYIVHQNNPLLQGLKQFYHYTLLPAESFFHVLVLNSEMCATYADDNLRLTLWRRSQGCLCQHRSVVDWCGCSPMVFRTTDWPYLSSSMLRRSTIFFARKFEAAIDQSIINRLEESITNSSANYQGWDGYWENVYHPADVTPAANPALIALASSLARHAVSLLNQDPHHCGLKAGGIKAVTSYFRHDNYQGDLIHFDVYGAQLEALVKPLSRTVFVDSGVRLLTALQVGSNYDPKEQILRNRIGVLSQLSKPVAFLKWSTNQNTSVQLVWFDPSLRVRAVHTVNITDTAKAGSQDLNLNSALTPGIWTVVAFDEERKLLSSEFLIVPLPDDHQDYPSTEHPSQKKWERHLETNGGNVRHKWLAELMKSNAQTYLDHATRYFYSVEDVCYVGTISPCQPPSPGLSCSHTEWSSFSPDPKSRMPS